MVTGLLGKPCARLTAEPSASAHNTIARASPDQSSVNVLAAPALIQSRRFILACLSCLNYGSSNCITEIIIRSQAKSIRPDNGPCRELRATSCSRLDRPAQLLRKPERLRFQGG